MKEAIKGLKLEPVSVLALKSILFPAHHMNLQIAWMPGDMVLFGSLQKD